MRLKHDLKIARLEVMILCLYFLIVFLGVAPNDASPRLQGQ